MIRRGLQEGARTEQSNTDFINAVQELNNLADRIQEMSVATEQQARPEQQAQNRDRVTLHVHNGRFIRIRPDFVFPKSCALRDIFFRFHVKDAIDDIPPLKLLDSASVLHIRRGKPTLSDLNFLMGVLEAEAQSIGKTTVGIRTQEEASELFEQIKFGVYRSDNSSKRRETLKWTTWATKCRRAKAQSISPRSWITIDV